MNTCRKCGNQWEKGDLCPRCGSPAETAAEYAAAPSPQQSQSSGFPGWAIALTIGSGLLILLVGGLLIAVPAIRDMQTISDEYEPVFEDKYNDWEDTPENKFDIYEYLPTEPEASDPAPDREQSLAYQQEHGIFTGEFYEVGVEVPPGEYVVMTNGSAAAPDFHMAVYTSASQSEESRLYGGWYSTCKYVILEEGQYIELTHAVLYDPVKNDLPLDPFSASGMYKVGVDLEPGTYTVKNISDQYTGDILIYSSLNSIAPVTRDFEFVDTGETTEVTLYEGEYIEMTFCCLE